MKEPLMSQTQMWFFHLIALAVTTVGKSPQSKPPTPDPQ